MTLISPIYSTYRHRPMRAVSKTALLVAALGLVTSAYPGLDEAHAQKSKPKVAAPSRAVTDATIDAIAGEIERSMKDMRIPGELAPYFIGHKLTEVEVNDVVASLGSTTYKQDRHFVSLDARVHVGGYDADNSNFVVANFEGTDGHSSMLMPMEATPRIARRVAWLVTDSAYKEALEQMRAKVETQRAGGIRPGKRDSYSKAAAVVQEELRQVPALDDIEEMERRAKKLSALFRSMPNVRDSRVAFTSFLERRWYLNSEGSSAHDTRRVSGVVVAITGQAEDGQELSMYYIRYGQTAADLPSDKTLTAEAKKLAKQLEQLRKAPVMSSYNGPVLFEDEAAADIVRYTLSPHLSGTPLPDGFSANEARYFGGGLNDRDVGTKVVSPALTVVDDPTLSEAQGAALIGGYRLDDEGVAAERVEVIEKGKLVELLTSRTPSEKFPESNGHARRNAPGGVYHGSATNLFITGNRSRGSLKSQLLKKVREDGLPYGVIIRKFDDPAVTAQPELAMREILQLVKSSDPGALPVAALAYKVYPDGREELVRGAQLHSMGVRSWSDVIAIGDKLHVSNFLASGEPPLSHKVTSVGNGEVPSSGVESAIVTPDLLLDRIEIVGNTTGRRAPPAIPRPTAK